VTADESGARGAQDARGLGALTHQSYPDDAIRAALADPALAGLKKGPAMDLLLWLTRQTGSYERARYRLVVERDDDG
jgi:hypothetical protein